MGSFDPVRSSIRFTLARTGFPSRVFLVTVSESDKQITKAWHCLPMVTHLDVERKEVEVAVETIREMAGSFL